MPRDEVVVDVDPEGEHIQYVKCEEPEQLPGPETKETSPVAEAEPEEEPAPRKRKR